MTRLLYNLIFPIVLLALLPGYILRMARRGNYRHKFSQRLGIYDQAVLTKLSGHRWTWIHAVSVGEVMIAFKLVAVLREQQPDIRVVLSVTTSTGYALASKNDSENFETIYFPLDFLPIVKRAFRVIAPERMIFVEAEVWPNVVATARKKNIPRYLVNARLSRRSECRYRLVRPFAAALFNHLDCVCVQESSDVQRWRDLGVSEEKIVCTGSVKFDSTSVAQTMENTKDFRPVLRELGVADDAPVLLAASSFDGEELLLAQAYRTLREDFPHLFLVLVPRHAERGLDIAKQLVRSDFRVALRSGGEVVEHPEIYIANTTGELRDWYLCATVAYIGKSLSPLARGGQNPAEALVAGCPVVFGPNMQNFLPLASQLVAARAAIEVADEASLCKAISAFLDSPKRRTDAVAAGRSCLESHRGATRRTADIVLRKKMKCCTRAVNL